MEAGVSCPESGTGWAGLDGRKGGRTAAGQSVCGVEGVSQCTCVSAGQKQAVLTTCSLSKSVMMWSQIFCHNVAYWRINLTNVIFGALGCSNGNVFVIIQRRSGSKPCVLQKYVNIAYCKFNLICWRKDNCCLNYAVQLRRASPLYRELRGKVKVDGWRYRAQEP